MKQLGSNAAILTGLVGVLIGASVVADRFGAATRTITLAMLALAMLSMIIAGITARTMHVGMYRAAAHRQPLGRSLLLVAVIGMGLVAVLNDDPALSAAPVLAAVVAGLCLNGLACGGLRRSGATSFSEAIHLRFRSRSVAILAALAAAMPLAVLMLLAGERATALLAVAAHLPPGLAALIVGGAVLMILLPGGAAGLASIGLILAAMGLAAWGIPAAALLRMPAHTPAEPWQAALATLGAGAPDWGMMAGLGAVIAGLFTLFGTASMAASARIARAAHFIGALLVLVAGLASAAVSGSVAMSTARLAGKPPSELPAYLHAERARDAVTVCGSAPSRVEDMERACRAHASAGVTITIAEPRDGRWMALVLGLPLALGVVFALAPPLMMILVFAAAVHALARLLTHDLIYRLSDQSGTASGRLALNRIVVVVLVCAVLCGLLPKLTTDSAVCRIAAFLAAAMPVPLVLLASHRTADWRAALVTVMAALVLSGLSFAGDISGGVALVAALAAVAATGWLAARLFGVIDPRDHEAADVFAGRAPGPLFLGRGA